MPVDRSHRSDAAFVALFLRSLVPRVLWTVVERDGRAEFVIWRQWLGRAYDINSIAALPGRYDRETDFGRLDPYPSAGFGNASTGSIAAVSEPTRDRDVAYDKESNGLEDRMDNPVHSVGNIDGARLGVDDLAGVDAAPPISPVARSVDNWLWRARHAIRQGNPRRAYEAMLSALWLLGVEHDH